MQISGCIITFNEEKKITDCLKSLDFCDEIVVVDSFSTDATLAKIQEVVDSGFKVPIAVYQQEFLGYAGQKNWATEKTKFDWVYNLDADERISPELKASIQELRQAGPKFKAYLNSRRTFYVRDWIRHSGWYPDKKVRLFHKSAGKWTGADMNLHDYFDTKGFKVGQLKGDILHYSFDSISDHIQIIDKYTEIAADEAVAIGKTTTVFGIIGHALGIFVKMYFFKLGFLDGRMGLILAGLSSFHVWTKYSKIWMRQKKAR